MRQRRRQYRLALINDGFQQLDRRLPRGAADVSGADIVIVGEDAGDLAIEIDALDPILFPRLATAALLLRGQCTLRSAGGGRFLAEIGVDAAAISAGVQGRDHALSVRANPDANVERDPFRGVFGGIRAADLWRRLPVCAELLGGESFDARRERECWATRQGSRSSRAA